MTDRNLFGFSLSLAAAIAFGSLSAPAAAAPSICDAITGNLIVNCGFERGNLRNWTPSGNISFTFVSGPGFDDGPVNDPNSGNFFAFLGSMESDGFLSQTFGDSLGQTLQIEFFLASDGKTPNDFHALFNGNELLT